MQHLTDDQLSELRAALDAEKADLEDQLSEHGQKKTGNWQGTPKGFDAGEADVSDGGDRLEELSINVPLVEELESRLKEVTDAIEKMDEGAYGLCEKGGEEIPIERLEANPAARTCVEHS